MNKQELIDYCNAIKENKNQFINCIDVNRIIKRIEQLDEPEKVVVPQFVAEWIEGAREQSAELEDAFEYVWEVAIGELREWFRKLDNRDNFARAWLDGYEVEKEKRYYIRLKIDDENYNYLNYIKHLNAWVLTEIKRDKKFRTEHTRKELEDAGFGEVFNSTLFEVEEVEE